MLLFGQRLPLLVLSVWGFVGHGMYECSFIRENIIRVDWTRIHARICVVVFIGIKKIDVRVLY